VNATAPALAAFIVVLVLAPAVAGLATRTKSALTGRRGAPVLQLYYDLVKLARRGAVISETTTWVFRAAPAIALATTLLAATVVPLDGRTSLIHFTGDAVAFAYVLGLGRFLLVLGALDTGSSFEGMGASRDVTFASLIEVALFLSFVALSLATHQLSFSGMLGQPFATQWTAKLPSLLLIAGSLFAILLAECARVPVDDPATHLELTMVHEVMVLDHSGPDLALILYAGAVKLSLFGALIVGVVVPRGNVTAAASIAILAAGLLMLGVGVGIVEATVARLRLSRVPLYLASAASLALFSVVLLLWSPV
jgi:formate hydrogenlyase subunit 4